MRGCLLPTAASAFLGLVGPALAQPFDGYWAGTIAACRNADSVDRLAIGAGAFQWYETRCQIRKVVGAGPRVWNVGLSCKGEGQSFSVRSKLSLPTARRLVIDDSPMGPNRHQVYIRCRAF